GTQTYAGFFISDGSSGYGIIFETLHDQKRVIFESGSLEREFEYIWNTQPLQIRLVRNEYARTISLHINETPVLTVLISQCDGISTFHSGIQFPLSDGFFAKRVSLSNIFVYATSTLADENWNIIFGTNLGFIANSYSENSINRIPTRYGPLTRGWGDQTLAT